jgi:tetratricopeptide (TPR) repeat protein
MKNILFTLTLFVSLVNYSQNVDEIIDKINNQKNYQSAINDLNQLIKQDATVPFNYYLRAFSYKRLKNFFNAKKDYLKSIELGFVSDGAYGDLAGIYFFEKDWNNAAVYYKKQLDELGGDDIFAHYNIAVSHNNSGAYTLANEYFTNVISINTDEELVADAYFSRGKSKNSLSDKSGCSDLMKSVDLQISALFDKKKWARNGSKVDYLYNSYCVNRKLYKLYAKQFKSALKASYK